MMTRAILPVVRNFVTKFDVLLNGDTAEEYKTFRVSV